MTRHIQIKTHKIKDGKLVPNQARLPVNVRLKQASSKKVRVTKRQAPT